MMSSLEMPLDLPDAMPYDGLSYRVRNRCGHCVACGSPCASPTQGSLALSIGSVQVHTLTHSHTQEIDLYLKTDQARPNSLSHSRARVCGCVCASERQRANDDAKSEETETSVDRSACRESQPSQTQSPNTTCSLTDEP